MVGRTISHYRILAKLGEGGMGAVYKAHDDNLDRDVALKFIAGGFGKEEEKRRFLREARAAASLQHPNICPIYEIDEAEGYVFFVMAYLEGKTVADLVEGGPLDVEFAADIGRQVASALEEAHEHGIVHRDIKSQNIIVSSKGRASILDFGLAQRRGQTRMTASGVALGTAPYMSPEQARGETTDLQTDLWSLGVVLYEALSGVLPFDSEHHLATMYSIINEDPPPLAGLRGDVPPNLVAVVERALAKEKDGRYQSATEMLADLGGATAERPTLSQPAAPEAPPAPVERSFKPAVAVGTVGAALAAAWFLFSGGPATVELSTQAQALYDQGHYYLQRYEESENLDQAIQLFEDAKSEARGSGRVEAGLAEAYYRKFILTDDRKWLDGALNAADRAVENEPGAAEGFAIRGLVQQSRGQTTQAIEDFEAALELDDENVNAVRGLAEAYASQGRSTDAEELYKKAIELAPADWTGYKTLGHFYAQQKRFSDSEEQFRSVIRLTPDNALAFGNLGVALVLQGKFEVAAEAFEKAIAILPRAPSYSNLGTIQYYEGNYPRAVAAYENAIELNPADETYWGNLGDALRRRGRPGDNRASEGAYSRAVELVERRLADAPSDAGRRSRLAYWLIRLDRGQDADAELAQALSLAPGDADVLFRAALIHEFAGRRNQAIEALRASIERGYSGPLATAHPDLQAVAAASIR